MADQATLDDSPRSSNANGRSSAATGVREGVGDLLQDVVSLGELQAQLLAVDARESLQKAQVPLVLLMVGMAVGLAAAPVLLLALGEALVQVFDWPRAVSYLVSGLVGAVMGGVLMYFACRQGAAVVAVFKRSQDELAENIRWIKYALSRGRRPPR